MNLGSHSAPSTPSDGANPDASAETFDGANPDASAETSDGANPDASAETFDGSTLLIPQRNLTTVQLGPNGDYNILPSLVDVDQTLAVTFADGPTYSRQFEVSFAMAGLFVQGCQFWSGDFEPETVAVEEAVDGREGHLSIEEEDGHYMLTHDGHGSHRVRVSGTFRSSPEENVQHCLGVSSSSGVVLSEVPAPKGSSLNGPLTVAAVPVSFTLNVDVRHLGGVRAEAPLGCAEDGLVLSGRNYPGTRIALLDDQGEAMYAQNVYDTYPLDVLVESEKNAQIAEYGAGLHYDGLVVTGEPQQVRLSTSFGPLWTYRIADVAAIDAWGLEFLASDSQYVKTLSDPMSLDAEPMIAKHKVISAKATMRSAGVPVCSPILASDFELNYLTPDVCLFVSETTPMMMEPPGFLATFVDPAATCAFELKFPGANGGIGLKRSLNMVLDAAK